MSSFSFIFFKTQNFVTHAGGLDFVNAAVTLTFSPARNTECFDVRILDDDDYEATEEFFVNLTTSDAQVRLSPHFTVMTIIDLDSELAASPSLALRILVIVGIPCLQECL